MLTLEEAPEFEFIGGNLALDFCNTMGGKRGNITREKLETIVHYLAWCWQARFLSENEAKSCLARAKAHPGEAQAALLRAIDLREAIFRVFKSCLDEVRPADSDLALLNAELSATLGRLRLKPAGDQECLEWQWDLAGAPLDHLGGPIAQAAAGLLTDKAALAQLHICQGDNCGWLFLDLSRNHSRRWCDMRDCGNRAKIRRHRLKRA
jgi:predicted RNA-binding Zn ribbon-like protein